MSGTERHVSSNGSKDFVLRGNVVDLAVAVVVQEGGPAEPTDVELLAQIRDLLAEGRNGVTAGRPVIGDGRSDERRV